MKKLFLLPAFIIVMATTTFATGLTIADQLPVKSFKYNFTGANVARREAMKDIIKAAFLLKDKEISALHNACGETATNQKVSLKELPTGIKITIAKSSDYIVKEAALQMAEEKIFLVTAENEKERIILKVTEENSLSLYQKKSRH